MRFDHRTVLALLWFNLVLPLCAWAHPVAQGSMEVEVQQRELILRARVSMEQLLVFGAHTDRPESDTLSQLWKDHGLYLLKHLQLELDHQGLFGILEDLIGEQRLDVLPTALQDQGFVRYAWRFPLERIEPASLLHMQQNILNEFDFAPGNRWEATFVTRVSRDGNPVREGLLFTSQNPLQLELTAVPENNKQINRGEMAGEFIQHGILHILRGYDHLLFVTALVLATVTFWDLIKIITAFTVAHTLTLTLATFNILRLPSSVVEPFIAASIVFVAIQNFFWPRSSRGAGRLAIAFFFGLFHGLGFARGLLDAMQGMELSALWIALIAFSLGVEIGHQLVVLPTFMFLSFLRRWVPSEVAPLRIQRIGSALIAGAGCFYFYYALMA